MHPLLRRSGGLQGGLEQSADGGQRLGCCMQAWTFTSQPSRYHDFHALLVPARV